MTTTHDGASRTRNAKLGKKCFMNIDKEIARQETVEQDELFTRFGDHLPREMELERELQLARLYHSPDLWDLSRAVAR